jgi:hypothetical protein
MNTFSSAGGLNVAEQGRPLTVSQVRHELEKAGALVSSLRDGLDFLAQSADHKILYLVDYPEIRAYWESWRPNSTRQLKDAHRVWNYLTGLEQIFIAFENDDNSRLRYLQRAYEDQAEYIDALLLSENFNTMISPPTWRLIRDNIIYVSHFSNDAIGNWNSAIQSNESDLRSLIGATGSLEFSESLYVKDAERFGFASLARERTTKARDLVRPFVAYANFLDPIDVRWDETYHLENAPSLRKELTNFDPAYRSASWLEWIDKGNNLYNEAYDRDGQWARRHEGAETLAYLEFLNETIRRHDPNLMVAFVTRNYQYQDFLLAIYK